MKRKHRLNFTSNLFILLGLIFLAPLFMLIPYQEFEYAFCFIIPAFLTAGVGLILALLQQTKKKPLVFRQKNVVVVVLIWLFEFVMGGVPFYLSGQLDFLRSVFESTSGWTATGLTMLDVTKTPYIFLFYRSWMQFLGGIGFVLVMLMFASGTEAMELFSAEGHPDKLEANLVDTARFMMGMYIGFTVGGAVLYMMFGMSPFDAFNHSMTALATGGFSTRANSIAYFNSVPIEAITIVLMLLGGTNFAILALLVKGKWKEIAKIGEMRFLVVLIALFTPIFTFSGVYSIYHSVGESFRISIFQIVTAITSTGFSTTDFKGWPSSMMLSMILLMLIGGGVGSTAGGIKYSRIYLLYKSFCFRMQSNFRPEHAVQNLTVYKPSGKSIVDNNTILQVHHFTLVYLVSFFFGSLLLTFSGMPLETALFEFSSALGTIGVSTGATNVNSSTLVLCVQIFGMLLARLEVYVVYIFIFACCKKIAHTAQDIKEFFVH